MIIKNKYLATAGFGVCFCCFLLAVLFLGGNDKDEETIAASETLFVDAELTPGEITSLSSILGQPGSAVKDMYGSPDEWQWGIRKKIYYYEGTLFGIGGKYGYNFTENIVTSVSFQFYSAKSADVVQLVSEEIGDASDVIEGNDGTRAVWQESDFRAEVFYSEKEIILTITGEN